MQAQSDADLFFASKYPLSSVLIRETEETCSFKQNLSYESQEAGSSF